MRPSRLPDLPEQPTRLTDLHLQFADERRQTFADICDGGTASDVLAARVGGLDAEGIEAGLRLGNAVWWALHGGTTGQDG